MLSISHQILVELVVASGTYGDRRRAYRVLVEKPEGKRPVARPRPKWERNCKIKIPETGWDSVDWIHSTVVKTVMNPRVLQILGIFWLDEELSASQEGLCSMEFVTRWRWVLSFRFWPLYTLGNSWNGLDRRRFGQITQLVKTVHRMATRVFIMCFYKFTNRSHPVPVKSSPRPLTLFFKTASTIVVSMKWSLQSEVFQLKFCTHFRSSLYELRLTL